MKNNHLLFFAFLLFCLEGLGQSKVTYSILSNDPMQRSKTEISINPVLIDVILPQYETGELGVALSTNVRVNHYPIMKKFGIDLNWQASKELINSGTFKRLNASVTYTIGSKQKEKTAGFELSRSSNANTTTLKSISDVKRINQINFEGRAGLSTTSGMIGAVPIEGHDNARYMDYKSRGLSLGVQLRSFYQTKLKTDRFGVVENGAMICVYADALIMPITTFEPRGSGLRSTPNNEEMKKAAKKASSTTPIGGVLGFRYSENRGRFFGWNSGMEVGVLAPHNALTINTYVGITMNIK